MNTLIVSAKFPIILIDGASCSGKSTIKALLVKDADLDLGYARRHTTRKQRPDDESTGDYIFIAQQDYESMKASGEFVECKDFLFGMSYGISWDELIKSKGGHNGVLAMVNLGNMAEAKRALPWACAVLIDAPIKSIRARLLERGLNTREQIDERLQNARKVSQLKQQYDYICFNEDGKLGDVYMTLKRHLRWYISNLNGEAQ